jgi:Phage tail tube protein, TTP
MAQTTNTGKAFFIGSTYAAAVAISAATNAAECVVTLAPAHGTIVGEWVHLSVGWARGNDRLFRVKTVSTNDVTLEGFNTTSTALFPAGGGVGTLRRVTAWAQISQVRAPNVAGGEQQYTDGSYLENPVNIDVPNNKTATTITLELAHDISLAYRTTVQAAQDGGVPVAFRQVNALGRPSAGACFWSIQNMGAGGRGDIEVSTVQCSFANEITHYAT